MIDVGGRAHLPGHWGQFLPGQIVLDFIRKLAEEWSISSVIKSTSCSSKGSGFDSYTRMAAPEDLRHTQAGKTSLHIKQNKILKKK